MKTHCLPVSLYLARRDFGSQKKQQNQEEPTEYKQRTWGKTENGEEIIDGYSFKGKQPFRRAKEGLEELFIKGAKSVIEKVKIFSIRC